MYYEIKLFNNQNKSKTQWKIVHELIDKRNKQTKKQSKMIDHIKLRDGEIKTDSSQIANEFNKFFTNVRN